jgi:wyosine [tRNA(Phe)-imidazoG37] synthetase (radical SAM superfamily)
MSAKRTVGTLTVTDHDRTAAGLTYVYPVVSRRAGGVSVGINLNSNNACNWRCIYCQVPDLRRGAGPPVDLPKLRSELSGFLDDVLNGDFMQTSVPAGSRRLNDIALSGNGEPTSATEFVAVVDLIGEVRTSLQVPDDVKTILITNGSLVHQRKIREGLSALRSINGEVWFKLDRATATGMRTMNDTRIGMRRVKENLGIAAHACPTWIQTCVLAINGAGPGESEQQAYMDFLREQLDTGVPLRGVLLYGLARASCQPEAPTLSSLPASWLQTYADRIRALGIVVNMTK